MLCDGELIVVPHRGSHLLLSSQHRTEDLDGSIERAT